MVPTYFKVIKIKHQDSYHITLGFILFVCWSRWRWKDDPHCISRTIRGDCTTVGFPVQLEMKIVKDKNLVGEPNTTCNGFWWSMTWDQIHIYDLLWQLVLLLIWIMRKTKPAQSKGQCAQRRPKVLHCRHIRMWGTSSPRGERRYPTPPGSVPSADSPPGCRQFSYWFSDSSRGNSSSV